MNALSREAALLLDLVCAPRAALGRLAATTPVGAALAWVGTLAAALVCAQSFLMRGALLADPSIAELPGGAAAVARHFWVGRTLAVAATPCATLLRAVALAAMLQAAAALAGAPSAWRSLVSLALHLEIVFVLEAAAATLLLALRPPPDLAALQSLQLRAGIDLVWEPSGARLAALVSAANAFTFWWAALLAAGLVRVLRVRARVAAALAAPLWAGLVVLRWLLQSH